MHITLDFSSLQFLAPGVRFELGLGKREKLYPGLGAEAAAPAPVLREL